MFGKIGNTVLAGMLGLATVSTLYEKNEDFRGFIDDKVDGIERILSIGEGHEPVYCVPESSVPENPIKSSYEALASSHPSFVKLEAEKRAEMYKDYATFQHFIVDVESSLPLFYEAVKDVKIYDPALERKRYLRPEEKHDLVFDLITTSYTETEGNQDTVGPNGELTEFQLMHYHLTDAGFDLTEPIPRVEAIRIAANLHLRNLQQNQGNRYLATVAYQGGPKRAKYLREAIIDGQAQDELVKMIEQEKEFPRNTRRYPSKRLGTAKAISDVLYFSE